MSTPSTPSSITSSNERGSPACSSKASPRSSVMRCRCGGRPAAGIGRAADGGHWESGTWFLRSERMYLLPGDSSMGYRLPVDGLPWVAPGDYPHLYERDPFAPREPLPPRGELAS